MTALHIADIRIDGGTQQRAAINWMAVAEYAADMANGDVFPPVVVFYDGANYWLSSGFHRYHAVTQLGLATIEAEIRNGTLAEAIDYACSKEPNGKNGMREDEATRRNRVDTMLQAHPDWSNYRIGDHCGVVEGTVRNRRAAICVNYVDTERTVIRGDTTYTQNTANIGRRETEAPEPLPVWEVAPEGELVRGEAGNYRILNNNVKRCEVCGELWAADLPYCPYCNITPAARVAYLRQEERARTEQQQVYQPMAATVYSHRSVEYYTPVEIIEAARSVLGGFDLDPATCEEAQENVKADNFYTLDDDGLTRPWFGRVWLNPPYGKTNGRSNQELWSQRLVSEYEQGNVTEAILLVKAALGYKWFEELFRDWPVCFARSRLSFILETGDDDGQSKQGTALFYFGDNFQVFARTFREVGRIIPPEAQIDATLFGQ